MLSQAPHQSCLRLARTLFAPDIAIAASDPRVLHDMLPDEAASLLASVPKRQREFSAGRSAARQAMTDLGHPALPVLQGADRAPVWPGGLTGSISHSKTACLGVVGSVRALGVDIEEAEPLEANLIPIICTPREQDWLAGQDPVMLRLIFSAKECAYKAQYTISRTLFGFDTLELTIDGFGFTACFLRDIAPFQTGDTLTGRFAMDRDHIITAMTLRA